MDKFSELKDALEFLETTEFDGEWDSALVGGENGKNYHAVINANDVVVRAADDSRHTSWLCDYLEAVSPVKIRALLAELEAKDERIGELEAIATEYAGKFQKAQDAAKHLIIMNDEDKKRISELESEGKVWESAALKHLARAEEAEKRLPILEQDKLRLNEIINSEANRADEAEKRLATPVRLPTTSGRLGVAYTRVIPEVIEAIRAAGFKVEGDE